MKWFLVLLLSIFMPFWLCFLCLLFDVQPSHLINITYIHTSGMITVDIATSTISWSSITQLVSDCGRFVVILSWEEKSKLLNGSGYWAVDWCCRESVRSCVRRICRSVVRSRMSMQYRATSAVSQRQHGASSDKRLSPSPFKRRKVVTPRCHCLARCRL